MTMETFAFHLASKDRVIDQRSIPFPPNPIEKTLSQTLVHGTPEIRSLPTDILRHPPRARAPFSGSGDPHVYGDRASSVLQVKYFDGRDEALSTRDSIPDPDPSRLLQVNLRYRVP